MERPLKDVRPIGPVAEFRQTDNRRRLSPFAMVRSMVDAVEDGADNGVVSERGVGSGGNMMLEWDNSFAGLSVELKFHETMIENDFTFTPDVRGEQGTSPEKLGGKVGELAGILNQAFDMQWDFAELDAASIGHEHLTDYEFEYEGIAMKSVSNVDLDRIQ